MFVFRISRTDYSYNRFPIPNHNVPGTHQQVDGSTPRCVTAARSLMKYWQYPCLPISKGWSCDLTITVRLIVVALSQLLPGRLYDLVHRMNYYVMSWNWNADFSYSHALPWCRMGVRFFLPMAFRLFIDSFFRVIKFPSQWQFYEHLNDI